jgi:hypothetical protein
MPFITQWSVLQLYVILGNPLRPPTHPNLRRTCHLTTYLHFDRLRCSRNMADTSIDESGQSPWVQKAFSSCLNASIRQDALIKQLEALRESMGEGIDEDTEHAFANIHQLVQAQDQEISNALSAIPDPLKATARSTELAYEVFGTMELLEEILSNLGFWDLMDA